MSKASDSTRRSKAEWQRLIEQQRQSKQSQTVFCRSQGIALATFQYWKRRLQTHEEATAPIDSPWMEVPLDIGSPDGAWQIELELGGGVRLRLSRR